MAESLAEYLKRVMHQRNLSVADVQASSGLSQSYINRLLKGTKTNLTVETIAILSEALKVDGIELFVAAYGKAPENVSIDPSLLADTIQKLVLIPGLIELVQNTAKMKSPAHQKAVFDMARVLALKHKADKKKKK